MHSIRSLLYRKQDLKQFHFSVDLQAAVTAAGYPATFTTYDGDHSFSGAARAQLLEEAVTFLRRQLATK